MKLNDLVGLTRNSRNNQVSFNIKAKKLRKLGITPQNLLDIKLPKNFKLIKNQKLKSIPVSQEQNRNGRR